MTAPRHFHCAPCKRGECDDCVRLIWHGEGCVHECYSGAQLALFAQADVDVVRSSPSSPVAVPDPTVDW